MEKITEEEFNKLRDTIEIYVRAALAKEGHYIIQDSKPEFREIWLLHITD